MVGFGVCVCVRAFLQGWLQKRPDKIERTPIGPGVSYRTRTNREDDGELHLQTSQYDKRFAPGLSQVLGEQPNFFMGIFCVPLVGS